MRRSARDSASLHCSFCGKSQQTVGKLISSPNNPRAYICDECVFVCASILEDDRLAAEAPSGDGDSNSAPLEE